MAEEPSRVGAGKSEVAGELRTARLTLVDAQGNVRAVLGPGGDGASGLHLYDGEDRLRAQLGLDASGATNLKLHDREGDVCAWLAAGRHGAPSLYLRGVSRHQRGTRGHAELAVDEHGCPVLSLHDAEGRPRVLLCLDEHTGMATLSYTDTRGDSCVLLGEEAGGGRLRLVDRAGRPRGVPTLPLGDVTPEPLAVALSERPPEPDPRVAVLAERLARLEETTGLDPRVGALEERVGHLEDEAGPDPRVRTLGDRLTKVERATGRRRPALLLAILLAAALGALASEATRRLVFPPPSGGTLAAGAGSVVRAEEVLLTDSQGAVRARLGLAADGTPALHMTDTDGESALELSVLPDSGPLLRLQGDRSAIVLSAPPGAPPSLGLHDGPEVVFQAPSEVARFPPPDAWP